MNFWFGEQDARVRPRGSGNDPQFRNALRPQKDTNEQTNYSFHQQKSNASWTEQDAGATAQQAKPSTDPATATEPHARSASAGDAMDPRQKQKKVKAIQDFINNAKKSKFSEWRKLK